jgi:glutathione synthase/RimK-type ligase-like ATP-grasp enzyme
MKIIILASETDNHTAPIKWALERAGYQVVCWPGVSWTEEQQVSMLLDEEPKVALGPDVVEPGDVIWIRRLEQPVGNPQVAEADKKFAEVEYRSFHHAVAYVLETLPVWVINRFSASRFINNKSVQLQFARNCGLRVPKALMSNSPKGVKDFLDHNLNRTICKSFTSHVWQPQSEGGVAITETFELTRDQLPADEVLTYAPAIYQDMVVKQFDIRTVLMGERVYSYALHNPLKALDWRSDAGMGNIDVEMVPTPSDVERGIVAFAKKSGLCFGSIDFAVDMHENWWFLEINERGQFLWLDQFNPKIKMQEKFCAFITAPEGSTQPLEEREGLFPSFDEYMKIYEEQQAKQEAPNIAAAAASSPYMSQEP